MTTRHTVPMRVTQLAAASLVILFSWRVFGGLSLTDSSGTADFTLFDGQNAAPIFVETNDEPAVIRAAGDLAGDVQRVAGVKPELINSSNDQTNLVIIGTLGHSRTVDRLAADGKLDVSGVRGAWESYVLQVIPHPWPGIEQALVIAGSDRRGSIYGIYQLSQLIGVSPWYWWADVPVPHKHFVALQGDLFKQGPPAVKYRGIFLNDEDWGLRPWASRTFDPATGNIGPKTYAKIFELLLRLHANYLWPAMHPDTRAFNFYPADKELADAYGIVMGSSHCEQMLRDNVDEWARDGHGDYNFVTNPDGVLKYWEERVRENGKYENIYTLGMRGIHDSGMPGGGTPREKAERLHTIIADQRAMLARWVNPDVTRVPQIFCPYKEVLELYRLAPDIPGDITLVWPDDNYGYIREFSDARERQRSGGAGVYYHVSYYGRPRDYLWLCSTPPALIAEEMTKAYDYGANRVWMLNVGDLKPAELDIEFFLKLAWNPHTWNGTNTYDLLGQQLARDFGPAHTAELTSIIAEYYRLNFQRKPEHMPVGLTNTFSTTLNGDEAEQRLEAWQKLSARAVAAGRTLPAGAQDAFFELLGYPVKAAAALNEKCLALDEYYTGTNQDRAARLAEARQAQAEIERLTDIYNNRIAGGKWRYLMSDNPRNQLELKIPTAGAPVSDPARIGSPEGAGSETGAPHDADFVERNHCLVMEAEHASVFLPGTDAHWQKIIGVGYHGEAVTVFPALVPVRAEPKDILSASPCLQYRIGIEHSGDWKFTVRALPTFSVEAGKPQRYAIAVDDEPPQIVSLPASLSETDRRWQENVLRNAALTASVHVIARPGGHTLKIWMVDPGIVLDTIAGQTGPEQNLGYIWPAETRRSPPNQ
ncbi:MAG TPA: glycosyl hydrolase 115 family protein [Verrucomicrobiae bacterium]|nr:glycosyl hydrolase 115 family protein [Verrucomicrobiae bacterium]